jgi:CRISPR type I-E-associated protein CasB/Cse2
MSDALQDNGRPNVWYGAYLTHLTALAGLSERDRPDSGALAELRAAARGRPFETKALRHVVPHLSEGPGSLDRRLRIGLIVGSLFASHIPVDYGDRYGRSIGRFLGAVDTEPKRIEARSAPAPTALERHLQILVASGMDRLPSRLRGSLARLESSGVRLLVSDYGQLIRDLYSWDHREKRVQYRWVRDFYLARQRTTAFQGEDHE